MLPMTFSLVPAVSHLDGAIVLLEIVKKYCTSQDILISRRDMDALGTQFLHKGLSPQLSCSVEADFCYPLKTSP